MHLKLEIACVLACFEYAQNPLQIHFKFTTDLQQICSKLRGVTKDRMLDVRTRPSRA